MFKKYLTSFILTLFIVLVFPLQTHAIENPLARPNNKIGIHILYDTELSQAAQLVNTNGGDWGYVLVPIQAGDKDLIKWQQFMDQCKKNHLIPIVRLATEGDYFNTQVWRKPNPRDIMDFANFLNSLDWPVKNRYVIVFNEVNRGDEWGGAVSPAEYSELLSFAVTVFKSKTPDFFIISAGLDNAAPNKGTDFMNEYDYMKQMNATVPNIFNQVDGLASHSYPNPGFSQPPNSTSPMGTGSFLFEKQLAKTFGTKDLPVFITETGWTADVIPDDKRAEYYKTALQTVWSDKSIVAITPFLLQSSGGPFAQFSFIGDNNFLTKQYQAIRDYPKVKGFPVTAIPSKKRVLGAATQRTLTEKDFSNYDPNQKEFHLSVVMQNVFDWIVDK